MWPNPKETADLVTFTEEIFCVVSFKSLKNFAWKKQLDSILIYLPRTISGVILGNYGYMSFFVT